MVSGLEFPAGIAFLPDGRMLVTERPGRLRVVNDGRLQREPLATFETTLAGETGALGIAVPPDLDADDGVYVFVTEPDGATNSIWRVGLEDGSTERVIEGIPAASFHNGGGLAFGHDGLLYVSNGEQGDEERA
ncbi:MAG: PQQ-dependent sugar dehydrogenase, partial [Actinomycetota bacterium]